MDQCCLSQMCGAAARTKGSLIENGCRAAISRESSEPSESEKLMRLMLGAGGYTALIRLHLKYGPVSATALKPFNQIYSAQVFRGRLRNTLTKVVTPSPVCRW